MKRPIRVGLIGPGRVAEHHINAIRRLGPAIAQVGGVVGSTPERGAAAAKRLGVPHFASLDHMLGDVELVHVTTPNSLHHTHVLAAIAAGCHVVCEKPLGLSSGETREMLEAAERRGIVHATHLQRRGWGRIARMRSLIATGELGDPWIVRGHYLQDWLVSPLDDDWRSAAAEGGAMRAALDLGPHWIDLVQWVTNQRVVEVQAHLTSCVPRETRSNDAASLSLTLDGGTHATATISQAAHGSDEFQLSLDLAHGGIDWNQNQPEELVFRRRGARSVVEQGPREDRLHTFVALYRAVYASVREGDPNSAAFPTFADGHDQALIMDAIGRSAIERRTVAVERDQPTLS